MPEPKWHKKYHSMCERCYEVPRYQANMRSVAKIGLCLACDKDLSCDWEEREEYSDE